MSQKLPLSKTSIVVTRPSHQNNILCSTLASQGATPITFPCIEICPLGKIDTVSFAARLANCELIIFISPNAVKYVLDTLPNLAEIISSSCKLAAVGESTAQTLLSRGIDQVLTPSQQADSEALLKLPELQNVTEKSVLIIKGQGGRALLSETLENRGANVHSIDVYQRTLPKTVNLDALNVKIDLLLFTSSESVINFLALTPKSLHSTLLNCQTLVGHPRIADKVSSLGFKKLPIIAATPSDTDMLAAINQWVNKKT